jgi:hypothetical protein
VTSVQQDIEILPSRSLTDEDFQTRTTCEIASGMIVVPADPTSADRMHLIEASGTLDFWTAPDEDTYDEHDGEPV